MFGITSLFYHFTLNSILLLLLIIIIIRQYYTQYYIVSGKKRCSIFASNFAKY